MAANFLLGTGQGEISSARNSTLSQSPLLVGEHEVPRHVNRFGASQQEDKEIAYLRRAATLGRRSRDKNGYVGACVPCREQKIQCDPFEPRCMQCVDSDRECSSTVS